MAIYYFDAATGNNANDGLTWATAKKDLDAIASMSVVDYNSLFFKPGVYYCTQNFTPSSYQLLSMTGVGGASGGRVIFKNYNGSRISLVYQSMIKIARICFLEGAQCFYLPANQYNLELRNCTIQKRSFASAAYLITSGSIQIYNCTFGPGVTGITTAATDSTKATTTDWICQPGTVNTSLFTNVGNLSGRSCDVNGLTDTDGTAYSLASAYPNGACIPYYDAISAEYLPAWCSNTAYFTNAWQTTGVAGKYGIGTMYDVSSDMRLTFDTVATGQSSSYTTNWLGAPGAEPNTYKFHYDFKTATTLTGVVSDNGNNVGVATTSAVKEISIYGSNSSSDYATANSGSWTFLETVTLPQHSGGDVYDLRLTPLSTTYSYRYYRFKIISTYAQASNPTSIALNKFAPCVKDTFLLFRCGNPEINQYNALFAPMLDGWLQDSTFGDGVLQLHTEQKQIILISGTTARVLSPVYRFSDACSLNQFNLSLTEDTSGGAGANKVIDSTPGDSTRTIEYRISDTPFNQKDASPDWIVQNRASTLSNVHGRYLQFRITFTTLGQ